MLQAIAFDFDGVLADTEAVKIAAYISALDKVSTKASSVNPAELFKYVGCSEDTMASQLLSLAGEENTELLAVIVEEKRRIFSEKIASGQIRIFNEMFDLAEKAKIQGIMLGLVTGSDVDTVETIFNQNDRDLGLFEAIVSRDDVVKPKPDPECYFQFLGENRQNSNSSIAIEDSIAGAQAAGKAGIRAFMPIRNYNESYTCPMVSKFATFEALSDALQNLWALK